GNRPVADGCGCDGVAAPQPRYRHHGNFASVRAIYRDVARGPDRRRAAAGNVGRADSQTDPAALSRTTRYRPASIRLLIGPAELPLAVTAAVDRILLAGGVDREQLALCVVHLALSDDGGRDDGVGRSSRWIGYVRAGARTLRR